jgi:hypothetical protein
MRREAMKQGLPAKRFILLVLGLLLLAACTSLTPTTTPLATPTALATVSPPAAPEETSAWIVTLDDDGQTITLQVGERFLLKLGEDYDWTVTVADESVVSRVIGVLVVRGAQGVYEVHRPGSTTLSTTGDPVCRRSQPPCAAPSRLFRLQVVVQSGASGAFIEHHRTGGVAGLDDYLTIDANGNAALDRRDKHYEFVVDGQTFEQLQKQLDQAGFSRLAAEYLPADTCCDLVEYTIAYQGHTVRTMDTAVPESLQPVLNSLNEIVTAAGKP